MAKVNYLIHYEKFQKYDGSLRKYCESRRPKLNYESTKKTFQKIKKGEYKGNKKSLKKSPIIPPDSSESSPKKKHTRRQKAFAQNFPISLIGAKAARDAGYSIKCARQMATANMKKPAIREMVEAELLAREKRTHITQDMIVNELADLALAKLEDVVTWDEEGRQKMIPLDDMNKRGRAAMKGLEFREVPTEFGNATEFKLSIHDRKSALIELLKHTAIPFHVVETIEEVTETYGLDILQQIQLFETLGYRVPKHLEIEATRKKDENEDFDLLGELNNEAFEEKLIERKKNEIMAAREAQLKIRHKELDELNKGDNLTIEQADADQD
ncbi:terminase small subunit [Candidatus Pacearchaeota archaeon]|nr:terminase small subunit [Candidatus Pacearchaeota archaeon]